MGGIDSSFADLSNTTSLEINTQGDIINETGYGYLPGTVATTLPIGLKGTGTNGMNLRRFWDEISKKSDLMGWIWQSSSNGLAFSRFSAYVPWEIGVERCSFASLGTKKDRIGMQFSLFKVRLSSCHSGQARSQEWLFLIEIQDRPRAWPRFVFARRIRWWPPMSLSAVVFWTAEGRHPRKGLRGLP